MSIGMGLTIPNISNLPGVSRPGSGITTDKYSLNFITASSSQVRYTEQTITDGNSINLWFNFTGDPLASGLLNGGVVLVGFKSGGSLGRIRLMRKIVSGENRILIRLSVQGSGGEQAKDYISTNILDSGWFNINISYGAFLNAATANIKVHLNGVVLNIDSEDVWTINPQYAAFGNNQTNSTTSGFQGQITQFAQFGTVITPSQALAIYNNGEPTDLSSYNPTIWYEFKEGPGSGSGDLNYLVNSGSLTVNSIISIPGSYSTIFPS